jgi:hypothetical protein
VHTRRQSATTRTSQADIARLLAISKGTVAFHVRNLGVPPDERFSRRYDWKEIQAAYDGGLSAGQCCESFGCSGASWGQAVRRGDIVVRPRQEPLNEVCEHCGLTEWRGEPVSLELHHVNGDPLDNRLESLQLLCPNCHAQTENYGIRNARQNGGLSDRPLASQQEGD